MKNFNKKHIAYGVLIVSFLAGSYWVALNTCLTKQLAGGTYYITGELLVALNNDTDPYVRIKELASETGARVTDDIDLKDQGALFTLCYGNFTSKEKLVELRELLLTKNGVQAVSRSFLGGLL